MNASFFAGRSYSNFGRNFMTETKFEQKPSEVRLRNVGCSTKAPDEPASSSSGTCPPPGRRKGGLFGCLGYAGTARCPHSFSGQGDLTWFPRPRLPFFAPPHPQHP